ncbi:hypothetical protein PHMEG_00033183 [Phytophthora megakarya]|uniref:Uncharacterized protein n=1 Tax=Phytophthora megakarya TaxID=4795 RepID=A0A225UTG2_9STRA|nr:hypothetical protein PHMEG_00033183 [Phytophthora megakarya]
MFANTMLFEDETLNLDEDVADVLLATLLMHFPDVMHLSEWCPLIEEICECLDLNAMSESELLAWGIVVRRAFMPPKETKASAHRQSPYVTIQPEIQVTSAAALTGEPELGMWNVMTFSLGGERRILRERKSQIPVTRAE